MEEQDYIPESQTIYAQTKQLEHPVLVTGNYGDIELTVAEEREVRHLIGKMLNSRTHKDGNVSGSRYPFKFRHQK